MRGAYFFDSYAIIEIIDQNNAYSKFKDSIIITNLLHLAEVYYYFLRNYNEKTADYWMSNLDFSFIDITPSAVIEASKFKYKHKKAKLSYADAIGYITAQKNGLKFLTGDKEFKNMGGVEFVK
jgi:predicted nucleic acid-binding protein